MLTAHTPALTPPILSKTSPLKQWTKASLVTRGTHTWSYTCPFSSFCLWLQAGPLAQGKSLLSDRPPGTEPFLFHLPPQHHLNAGLLGTWQKYLAHFPSLPTRHRSGSAVTDSTLGLTHNAANPQTHRQFHGSQTEQRAALWLPPWALCLSQQI